LAVAEKIARHAVFCARLPHRNPVPPFRIHI
jgi:hypothetical protein